MRAKPKISANHVRSSCKLCPNPVLVGEKAEFIADPPGLSHKACIERLASVETPVPVGGDR